MEKIILKLQEIIAIYGLKILSAVAILIFGKIIANIFKSSINKVLNKTKMDKTLSIFISNLAYIAIITFIVIAALGQIGIQTTSFVAALGAAGLAVGLAFQGSLSNLASGVLLVGFKPFKIGDFIQGAGVSGIVQEIGIFATILKSPDNKKIIVPNSKLTSDNIINFSAEKKRRIDLIIGVSYEDNLDKVKKVLEQVISEDSRILKDPSVTIGVLELADSSINFAVRPWVETSNYWDVYFSLQENIKKRFDAENISIPYPQKDIHLYNK